jgi:hypothetical protein
MNTCKDCKHWERNKDEKYAGRCDSEKFVYSDGNDCQKDGLQYWDYEGYSAGFETGEDFGCIHWEAK